MKIPQQLIDFLELDESKEMLIKNDFYNLYKECAYINSYLPSKLTYLLYKAGIDPLDYMDRIPGYFLSRDKRIKIFYVPEHIHTIGVAAFSDCINLKLVNIPEGVTSILSDAFWGCKNLDGITFPKSLKEIGPDILHGCEGLNKNVYFEGTVEEWNNIIKPRTWCLLADVSKVYCADGDVEV